MGGRRQIGDVETARVRRAIGADQPGAVDRETHRQVLDRDIVDDLIVGALEEGRIDRAERTHPLRGKPRGDGHRVLLGDPDVESAIRVRSQNGPAAWRRSMWPHGWILVGTDSEKKKNKP